MPYATPVQRSERIQSIDVLRGFALLGIFVMNIQAMSMIGSAYQNPTSFQDLSGANHIVWWIGRVFFDQKMMTIFSLLFGAGIALMTDRAKSKTGKSTGLHYCRMLWLMVFGMIHAYAIWYGDILVCYAICGMLFYWIRNWKPVILFVIGMFLIAVPSLINVGFDALISMLDETQHATFIVEANEEWLPSDEEIQDEVAAYQGSWMDQMEYRAKYAFMFQTKLLGLWSFWRAGGLMLIGMAFFRWRILSAVRSNTFYLVMALAGFGLGLPTIIYGIEQNWLRDWEPIYSLFTGSHYNYWGSLGVAAGYIAGIMFLIKNDWLPTVLSRALAAVGQMALTNYLMHSVIGSLIFYGHGLGMFGQVSRTGQFLIVLVVWLFQLVLSTWWLKRFRFGPMEWLWRSLSYWNVQPMRRENG